MLPLAFLVMQFIVSAKAGLVNFVDGQANVHMHEQIPAGKLIETGPAGHVEVLLNPGSFLRLGENSSAIFESVDLTNISVRLVSGSALMEAGDIDKRTPIRVMTGSLKVSVVSSGTYRFSGDTAAVLDGKLRTADGSITVKKGQQITDDAGQYEQSKVPLVASYDDLEVWSHQRSGAVARANALAYNGQTGAVFYPYGFNGSAWMYSPYLSGFTFIPRSGYRSYWGYSFFPAFAFFPTYAGGPVYSSGGGGGGNRTSTTSSSGSPASSQPHAPVTSSMGRPSQTPTFSGFGGPHSSGGSGGSGGHASASHSGGHK
jgi:hypothetical protein